MSLPDQSIAAGYMDFIRNSGIPLPLPDDTELLYPYDDAEVIRAMEAFYGKYYGDGGRRIFLIGINPGRFGGGVTGIPFTDPYALEKECAIAHGLKGNRELSSRFIYEMIRHCGGPDLFYGRYFLTAFSALGFTWKGKNRNYYDTPALMKHLESWLAESFQRQMALGGERKIAFSLGQGKNFKILKEMNHKYKFFDDIRPLPHPRWVMQYRSKEKETFLDMYKNALEQAWEESR